MHDTFAAILMARWDWWKERRKREKKEERQREQQRDQEEQSGPEGGAGGNQKTNKAKWRGGNQTTRYGAAPKEGEADYHTFTLVQAKLYPNLKVVSLSPGFIDTPMTAGFGARLTPEQGCVSSIKCLFEPVTSGYYYVSAQGLETLE